METKVIDKATGKILATGSKDQMFSFVKHHVPDGRYIIENDTMIVCCLRKNGDVSPDPEGVLLQRHT